MATGPFPTVDEILNKLKSNGTFDQFRKTCLASIEAEPSFRAYGEHIEVVSRRYLHNYKWRDSTTKNQVRSRLKDHALSVIASPDIQVGVPFSSLVEKAMESKGKELLPKIEDMINILRLAKSPPASNTDTTAPDAKVNKNKDTVNSVMDIDLSLPIDLPGLATTTSSLKKEPSGTDNSKASGRVKTKSVDQHGSRGGGNKAKNPQGSGDHAAASSNKEGKLKEKEEAEKRRPREKEEAEKGRPKEKEEAEKGRPKEKEDTEKGRPREKEEAEKGRPREKEEAEKGRPREKEEAEKGKPREKEEAEKAAVSSAAPDETSGSTKRERPFGRIPKIRIKRIKEEMKEKVLREKSKERAESKVEEVVVCHTTIKVEQKSKSSSGLTREEGEQCGDTAPNSSSKKGSESSGKKPLPARRRSARLASLTEKNENNSECESGEGGEQDFCATTEERQKPAKAKNSRSRAQKRKRAKVYSSSGESEDEEATPPPPKVKHPHSKIAKESRRGREREAPPRKRHHHHKQQHSHQDAALMKRARQSSPSPSNTSSSTNNGKTQEQRQQDSSSFTTGRKKPSRRKSQQPQRYSSKDTSSSRSSSRRSLSKSPPLLSPTSSTVTRFNRQVKPNRRYYSSCEEQMESSEGEGGRNSEEEEGERSGYEEEDMDISDFSEEEVAQRKTHYHHHHHVIVDK